MKQYVDASRKSLEIFLWPACGCDSLALNLLSFGAHKAKRKSKPLTWAGSGGCGSAPPPAILVAPGSFPRKQRGHKESQHSGQEWADSGLSLGWGQDGFRYQRVVGRTRNLEGTSVYAPTGGQATLPYPHKECMLSCSYWQSFGL